jgi:lipid II:glycine glycyltransferase (peptidoglycan interpeptide bridge formation enzyme)
MSDTFTFTELGDEEFFDPLSISNSAPFPQSAEFKKWQQGLGREVRRFLIKCDGEIFGFFQTIKYELPFGKSFVYSPYGPVIRATSPELLSKFLPEFKKYLLNIYRESNVVFIKLDFSLISDSQGGGGKNENEKTVEIFRRHFKNPPKSTLHSAYLQPRAEWYLDITDPEDALLKRMHEKTRYLINLSKRKCIQTEIIEKDFKNHFENFYSLLKETAQRNGFSLHPKKYYENIFDRVDKSHNEKDASTFISIAKYENKILVMNLVVKYSDTAHFIFGGSSNEHRNISPSHAAHWAAILHAKKIGAKNYNFGGISVEASEIIDGNNAKGAKQDHLSSLTSFKKKFGGCTVLHEHCYDLVIKPMWYYVYVLRKIIMGLKNI